MVFKLTPEEKFVREKTRLAITQATENNWRAAANTNLELLEIVPHDVEASNRLGRAYIELSKFDDALSSFKYSLSISPYNTIANKNIERLSSLGEANLRNTTTSSRASSSMLFISDSGKSTRITLSMAEISDKIPHFSPGTPLKLRVDADGISILDTEGRRLGVLPPKLGFRLTRLIEGGNLYEAILVSIQGTEVSVLLREVHQAPSQRKLVSFPPQTDVALNEETAETRVIINTVNLAPTGSSQEGLPEVNEALVSLSEDDFLLTAEDDEDLDDSEELGHDLDSTDDLEDDLDGSDKADEPDPLDDNNDPLEVSSLDSEIDAELEEDEDDLD